MRPSLLSVDPDRSYGYKKYWSRNFRAGLRLLVEHFPELRRLLVIKDLDRTPRTPAALLNMLMHLHVTKQLPAGVNMEIQSSRQVERQYSSAEAMGRLAPGPATTRVTLFFGHLTICVEFSNKNSPDDALFSYKAVQKELPQVVVHAEGMLVLEETVESKG